MDDEAEGLTYFNYFGTFSFYAILDPLKGLGSWAEYEENSFWEKIKTQPSNKLSLVTVNTS